MEVLRTFAVVLSSIFFSLSIVRGQNPAIQAIYQFGDSIADSGNGVKEGGGCGYPPYGETFFHHPSGRCSDGLLIVDNIGMTFIASFVLIVFNVSLSKILIKRR